MVRVDSALSSLDSRVAMFRQSSSPETRTEPRGAETSESWEPCRDPCGEGRGPAWFPPRSARRGVRSSVQDQGPRHTSGGQPEDQASQTSHARPGPLPSPPPRARFPGWHLGASDCVRCAGSALHGMIILCGVRAGAPISSVFLPGNVG